MRKPNRVTIVNGEERATYENTEEAKDVIYDLVVFNDSVSFHSGDVKDGELVIEVLS